MVRALTAAGYELRVREPGHRMFRTPRRDVHVHVWPETDAEVTRYLRFRDTLRRSAEDRRAYERLKRELARRDVVRHEPLRCREGTTDRRDPQSGRPLKP